MLLVIDTNILISALIKNSTNRRILLLPDFKFIIPEYAFEEIENHISKIKKISGLSKNEIELLLSLLLENVNIIPHKKIQPFMAKANKIIGDIDIADVPFIATALATINNGIWTNDKHFQQIKDIQIWTTKDILVYLSQYY